jgi:hypothetical protein
MTWNPPDNSQYGVGLESRSGVSLIRRTHIILDVPLSHEAFASPSTAALPPASRKQGATNHALYCTRHHRPVMHSTVSMLGRAVP